MQALILEPNEVNCARGNNYRNFSYPILIIFKLIGAGGQIIKHQCNINLIQYKRS